MTSPETLELEAVDAALAGRYVAPEHAELAELALLLRDDKPEPSEAWATHLDRRVEAGFPARPKERRVWIWMRNLAPAMGLAACVLAIVVAATVIEPGGDDSEDSGSGAMSAASEDAASGGGVERASGDDSGLQQLPPTQSGGDPGSDRRRAREQQRSATLTLAVPRRELDQAASRVGQVTADLGGFVASSSVSSSGGGHLQLRIPTERLDTAIQRLSEIGRVRELSRRSVDITSSVVSARDRLSEARAERKALLAQLASATTVNETESIRARLDIVSREIAAARRRLARVNNQANFADVSVTLAARGAADEADEGAWTPADAFDDALRVLEVAAGIALLAAAVLLPFALIWLLAWLARRAIVRRRRERALDMA
jgi:Domain of unknown function (DUF4349)